MGIVVMATNQAKYPRIARVAGDYNSTNTERTLLLLVMEDIYEAYNTGGWIIHVIEPYTL
jgi:hypothetical protein